jgi:hypothetical protein
MMLSELLAVATTPSAGDYDGYMASGLTAASVIIVYHLFALQTWLERVERVNEEAIVVEREAGPKDVRRSDIDQRLRRVVKEFPIVQLGIVATAVFVICALSLIAATRGTLPLLFSATPIVALVLVLVASTFATWLRGRRIVCEARTLLGLA